MNLSDLTFFHGVATGVTLTLRIFFVLFIFHPWIKSIFSAAPVSFYHVLGMRLRGNSPYLLIDAYIHFVKDQKDIELEMIEVCYIKNKHSINDLGTLLDAVKDELKVNP